MMQFVKSHAYGNDFLLAERASADGQDPAALARAMCDRHTGVGADGLILYELTAEGASMRLHNADGGIAEVSGNGVRCLAALVLEQRGKRAGPTDSQVARPVVIDTDAGSKSLTPIGRPGSGGRLLFRAAMGQARDLQHVTIELGNETITAIVLSMGNPHCVIPGLLPSDERFRAIGAALERHPRFPGGTNVEFSEAQTPTALKILIWERGVGPTMSSGTGTCAAAAAVASFTPGDHLFDVTAPGGTQRVECRQDGVFLTGWAELVFEGTWLR
ncbi:MAG TPA: diaminopimelate epimerase [Vicinamibacterales bacterium]|jgi:diaminopimelate epimerase